MNHPSAEAKIVHRGGWQRWTSIVGLILLFLAAWVTQIRAPEMTTFLVQTQDIPALILLSAAMLLVAFWQPAWRLPPRLPRTSLFVVGGIMLAGLLAWGTYAIMGNFPLSRDEHMVVFDMAVFEQGRLAAPLAFEWRPYGLALVPHFLLNENQPSGLVSSYLPMNALLRLSFSKLGDSAWFNPLLVMVGGIALLDIAKRVFGRNDRVCWVILLVYLLSAQVLVTAMTTYAMTAHLALNLVWLAAFLRGGRAGNAIALATGFVATGLHQLVFHPFFVAPFLLWRLRQGESKLVLIYAVGYCAFVLWWAVYPLIVSPLVAGPHGHSTQANVITDKLIPLLQLRDPRALILMILNVLRFVAWQNLALLPLLIAATPALRARSLPGALALGIVAWLLFLAIILPEQGRGYGYRYLHGYIGNFALLAGFGYRELEQRIGSRADGLVVVMSGVSLALLIPLDLVETYRFIQPRIAMEHFVAQQRTPFILIDDTPSQSSDGNWADDGVDYVRNAPNIASRPLRFSAAVLSPDLLVRLCRRAPITLVTKSDMHHIGFAMNAQERSPKLEQLVAAASRQVPDCFRAAAA